MRTVVIGCGIVLLAVTVSWVATQPAKPSQVPVSMATQLPVPTGRRDMEKIYPHKKAPRVETHVELLQAKISELQERADRLAGKSAMSVRETTDAPCKCQTLEEHLQHKQRSLDELERRVKILEQAIK